MNKELTLLQEQCKTLKQVGTTLLVEKSKSNHLSVFNGLPPAQPQQIKPLLARLAVNFPKMNQQFAGVSFWTMLGEQLQDLGWSEQRVRYAVTLMLQNYKYATFTAADFLEIDKDIPHWTSAEVENMPTNQEYVNAKFPDRWWICLKADAERLGLEYKTWITNAQKRERGL